MIAASSQTIINIEKCVSGLHSVLMKAVYESIAESDRKLTLKLNVGQQKVEIFESSNNSLVLDLTDSKISDFSHHLTPVDSTVEQNTRRLKKVLLKSLPRLLEQCDQYSISIIILTVHKGRLKGLEQKIVSTFNTNGES